jgi:hypothetical protein
MGCNDANMYLHNIPTTFGHYIYAEFVLPDNSNNNNNNNNNALFGNNNWYFFLR